MLIYEVKSVVRIGYINLTLIESINILERKLKLIFGVNEQPIITEEGIVSKLDNLKDSIELEKLKLSNNLAKNSEIVGSILVNDNPVKPKKALIIIVSFVTAFILSLLLVFFMSFISKLKKP